MASSLNIAIVLAAGDIDVIEIVIVLLFILISVIGGLIKKAGEKRQELQRRRRPTPKAPPGVRQGQPHATQGKPPAQRPPVRVAQPPRGRVVELQSAGTAQSAEARRLRLQKAELARRRKRAAKTPLQADSTAGRRPTYVRGRPVSQTGTPERLPPQIIGLLSRSQARQAIIYHEIFSPPKALREGPEMWDT